MSYSYIRYSTVFSKWCSSYLESRMEKFNSISTAHGIKFHPIIFETTVNPFDICNLNFVISLATWMVSYCKIIGLIVYPVPINNNLPFLFEINFANKKGYRFIMGNFENNPEFAIASGSVFLTRH